MVYKLKPLELGIDLEDREYELGDAINVQVTLTPNGDVRVRQARVDLVCKETYARSEKGIVMGAGGVGEPEAYRGGIYSSPQTTCPVALGPANGRSLTSTAASSSLRTQPSALGVR